MNKFFYEKLIEQIEKHEGFRSEAYQDSLGFWTIGHGIKELEEDESDAVVRMKVNKLISKLKNHLDSNGISIDEFRFSILVEMGYQLGFVGLLKFKKMWTAIAEMDYERASAEMLDSKWAKQTNVRARYLAKKMLMGV